MCQMRLVGMSGMHDLSVLALLAAVSCTARHGVARRHYTEAWCALVKMC